MAVEQKTVFKQNLKSYQTFIQDTAANSTYFKITELGDTFTGGKNAFLIEGSDLLKPGSEIKIEILDSSNEPIYLEYSEGYATSSVDGKSVVTEYYEGTSKVVAVYVYSDTPFGPSQITILGEAALYIDQNGNRQLIPDQWKDAYNVKWQKNINVNPLLPNTTKVRFYKRPTINIVESLEPIYTIVSGSKIASAVTASFANVTISQLDTFAGDVKRVKVYRTSEGDISDYDLIQDILIESKDLLETTLLSGSVKSSAGIFTSNALSKAWNTGSLTANLNSTYVDSGVELGSNGYLRYTSSLDLQLGNTYELALDVFFTGSSVSTLKAYISGTENGVVEIGSFEAELPTKNYDTTTFPFTLIKSEPTASLYLSQSAGNWNVGNITLKISEDTAFSPSQVSFITAMPTVIGNETFNFKFEFYDVNNNYVPVAVTGSKLFTGGNNNVGGTLTIVSASTSALSQSVSNDLFFSANSITNSLYNVSSSVSSSISTSVSYTSASVFVLSGSVSNSINLVSGSFSSSLSIVSGSVNLLSASVSTSLAELSRSISSSISNSAFTVYSASAYLDNFIFNDENGKLNKTPTTGSENGLFLGSTYLGYYSGSRWKTYMDDQGDFYLTGSNNNFLAWSGQLGTLQVQGVINIQGGNAATTSSVETAAANAVTSGSNSATAVSNSLAPNIFTNSNGLINRPPSTLVGVPSGLYLSPSYMGYYNGANWNTYMGNDGNFFLTGSASNYLKWNGSTLEIQGAINITGGNAATSASVYTVATNSANTAQSNAVSTATTNLNASSSTLQSNITGVDDKVFTNALGRVTKSPTPGTTSGLYLGNTNLGYYNGSQWRTYMDNTGLFYLTGSAGGNALLWDGSTLTIKGNLSVGSVVPNSVVDGLGTLALRNTVAATHIDAGAVTDTKIASDAVTEAKIATGAVSVTKIVNSAITEAKIANDAISSGKIQANAIVAGKIATDAIVAGNIQAGAIIAGKIATDAIVAGNIQAGAITAGKIATDAIVAGNIQTDAITAGKIQAGAIIAGKIATDAITANNIQANQINASKVSSLQFSGKDARFDTGSIAGWNMDTSGLYKTTGAYTLRLASNSQRIAITEANSVDSIDRVIIDASTDIPTIAVSDTGSINWSNSGQLVAQVYGSDDPSYEYGDTGFVLGDGGGYNYGYGWGIVGLQYANEEIFIESENFPNISNIIYGVSGFGSSDQVYGYWNCTLRVRKYPTATDAVNQTNQDTAYGTKEVLVAYKEYRYYQWDTSQNIDRSEVFGATIPAAGQGGINTPGNANWYRIELNQSWYAQADGGNVDSEIRIYRPATDIFVKFGRVANGYSVFSPGGLQVYQGVRNYMNASLPSGSSGDSSNFFIVKGKSQIIGSLNITSGLSANSKQFKIQHPINENKWLFHTATESPRADLIYRGIIELSNGIGSASIDSESNMTTGTFELLTKNAQLFLQNNESFDRVKGNVESGSVYVISENQNSTASIDWTVIAERNDSEILKSPLYDRNGKYKPEKFKSDYLDSTLSERMVYITGSI
jgi:hypothetical protein